MPISARGQKRAYLTCYQLATLETVCFRRVAKSRQSPIPRRNHLMCALTNGTIMLTGGFGYHAMGGHVDYYFKFVYILNDTTSHPRWFRLKPTTYPEILVYHGATLTPLDERRAVCFGGSCMNGLATNQVAVLTLTRNKRNMPVAVSWQTVRTKGPQPTARDYHSAALVQNRYLLIVGGRISFGEESILQEAILDTETWTWLDKNVSTPENKPSERHGHSVILDERRNRLLLFGGENPAGNNNQAWELKMTSTSHAGDDISASLPWTWNKIDKERPTLGDHHVGFKVAANMVFFAFHGSADPPNGILAYDLATNKFHRPTMCGPSPLPLPCHRGAAAAAVVRGVSRGWLFMHGGYSPQANSQASRKLSGDNYVGEVLLDLAPGSRRGTSPTPSPRG